MYYHFYHYYNCYIIISNLLLSFIIIIVIIFKNILQILCTAPVKSLSLGECHRTSLMMINIGLVNKFGAIRQQAITGNKQFWSISLDAKYSRAPLLHSLIFHGITYSTAMTVAERRSDFKLTIDTPYLTLMGELWGICCKDIGENWLRYNGTTLYVVQGFNEFWNVIWYICCNDTEKWILHGHLS